MGKAIQIRVDESLAKILEKVRQEVAVELKDKYKLEEITVHGTLASQIAAAKLNGKEFIDFKIRKVNLNKGILELA